MDPTQPLLFADHPAPGTKRGGCAQDRTPAHGGSDLDPQAADVEGPDAEPWADEARPRRATVEEIVADLTRPQRAAVTHTDGPLLILAGPGTGKTRVVTRRAAYLALTVARPSEILAITFTNKAAREMRERIEALGCARGMAVGTFHAFCAGLLRRHADRAGVSRTFTIFDRDDRRKLLQKAIDDSGVADSELTPASVEQQISTAKNQLISPQDWADARGDWRMHLLGPIYARYEELLAGMDALDFDDLLMRTARWLSQDEALRAELENRYRYVLVDEYQDTNACQYQIARLLTRNRHNLCATGDPDQSIYGWRGANIKNILSFERDYPRAKVVRLEQNYRSTRQILAIADHLIVGNVNRKQKTLWTENEDGASVRAVESESAEEEAAAVAEDIARRIRTGTPPSSIAVFYRVNSLSRTIEEALLRAGIAYQVARGVEFYSRREVKDSLSYLRVLVNPADEIALLRIINTPARGIGSTTVDRLVSLARTRNVRVYDLLQDGQATATLGRSAGKLAEFAGLLHELQAARDMPPDAAVEFVLSRSGLRALYGGDPDAEDSPGRNLDELRNAAATFRRDAPDATLTDWLEYAALVSDVDAVSDANQAVTLMTLHAAKGLEFDCVYLIAMENGMLPFFRGKAFPKDMEEERRLCFVGMTRARKRLTLSYARYRMVRGGTVRLERSPFLDELPRELIQWTMLNAVATASAAPSRAPGLPEDIEQWAVGTLVRHPVRGLGQIVALERGARRTHVEVLFQDGRQSTWALEFADLTRVEYDEIGE